MIFLCLRDIYLNGAPIDFLPLSPEVIRFRSSWLVVTAICRQWRQVAHAYQPLWDFVLVTKKGNFNTRLSLAGNRPLSVACINTTSPDPQWTKAALQRTIGTVLPRLRHLALKCPLSWLSSTREGRSAPLLETLTLACTTRSGGSLPYLFIHGFFPKLQSLSLYNYTIQLPCNVLCSTIRFLDINGPDNGVRPTRNSMFACLREMRSLEVLTLDRILGREDNLDNDFIISLPSLRAVSVSDFSLTCARFMEVLSCPSTTRIKLDSFAEDLPLLGIPIAVMSVVLGNKLYGSRGSVPPFATISVEDFTSRDTDGNITTAYHLRAWRFCRPLVSDFGYMQSGIELAMVSPDLDFKFASRVPFHVSSLCRHIPLNDVRRLGLSCAGCRGQDVPAFIIDVAERLCPGAQELGIMDCRLLDFIPYLLAGRTQAQNKLIGTRSRRCRNQPIFPDLSHLILPDLSTEDQGFEPSQFVATVTSAFNKRKKLGGGTVTLTMCCCGKLTDVDHKRLQRAAGKVKCDHHSPNI